MDGDREMRTVKLANVGGMTAGKIEYDVPDFVKITIDPVERQASLSVEDSTIKQQREMWGESFPPFPEADFLLRLLS